MFHLVSSFGDVFATTTMVHASEREVMSGERRNDVSVNLLGQRVVLRPPISGDKPETLRANALT